MSNGAIRVAHNDLSGVVWLHLTLEWPDLFYALKRRKEENFEDTFYTGCAPSDILEMPGIQTRSHQSVIREDALFVRNEKWSELLEDKMAFSIFNVLFYTVQMRKTTVTPSGLIKSLYLRILIVAIDPDQDGQKFFFMLSSLQKAGCIFHMWWLYCRVKQPRLKSFNLRVVF